MVKPLVGGMLLAALSLSLSAAIAAPKPGARPGGGGEERKPAGRPGGEQPGNRSPGGPGEGGRSAAGNKSPGGSWSTRSHAGMSGEPQFESGRGSSAEGAAAIGRRNNESNSDPSRAAAGAAAANRNNPQATGAQGAEAGAAAANRNNPQATAAQGAAAGAAAANRNNPQYSGAQGAAAGAAAANRNAPQYSGAQGAAAGAAVAERNQPAVSGAVGYAAVRNSVDHPNIYGQSWYTAHPTAWVAPGWNAGAAWAPVTWAALRNQVSYPANQTPINYNYGVNVTCPNGNVMVNGQDVGTAEDFSQQAFDLAQSGASAPTTAGDQWLSLGVFALVRDEKQHAQLILQLAVNQQGVLRGNYTDQLTDNTLPIQGAVDTKTSRAAWTVGSNTSTVMEAGLANLSQNEAPALIHKNGKTEHWILVRLAQPAQ